MGIKGEKINKIILECLSYEDEREWFKFKENVFKLEYVSEYISVLSNSAAVLGRKYAYLIWGINDKTHEIVGTTIDYNKDVNNEPMITFYSDRIEILSRGTLSPLQTLDGFYKGHSIPINDKLSELFLQLHISEKTGRGIPKIISVYGKEAIQVNDNNLIVTIPFNRVYENSHYKVGNKVGNKNLNNSQIKVLAEIRNYPNITKQQLVSICELSKTSIDNIISVLKKLGYIERVGSNKTGYWKVNK